MFHPSGSKEGVTIMTSATMPNLAESWNGILSSFRTIFAFIFIFKNKLFPGENKKAIWIVRESCDEGYLCFNFR